MGDRTETFASTWPGISHLPVARRLVVAAVRAEMDSASPLVPNARVENAWRVAEVISESAEIAEANKLLGEFAAGLARLGIEPPMTVMTTIARYRANARRKAVQSRKTLDRIDKALAAAGVSWVAYKGQVLQIQLGGASAYRPANDVDILVRRADFERAATALLDSGCILPPAFATPWWRNWLGELPLAPPPGLGSPIDLHYKVQQPGCPLPYDTNRFLMGRVPVDYDGLTVPGMSLVNAALMAAICVVKAFARHEPAGSHALDLAKMLRKADPEFLSALEQEARAQRLVNTLAIAREAVTEFAAGDALEKSGLNGDGRPEWSAMILTPDATDHVRLRGRHLLWQLSEGTPLLRAGRFARDSLAVFASERSRVHFEREGLSDQGYVTTQR
ncbi:MAG: nucleotidyltransferase family protein [Novosphingobium sp.]